jgi:hypothetical protein
LWEKIDSRRWLNIPNTYCNLLYPEKIAPKRCKKGANGKYPYIISTFPQKGEVTKEVQLLAKVELLHPRISRTYPSIRK